MPDGGEFDLKFGFGSGRVFLENFQNKINAIPRGHFLFSQNFSKFVHLPRLQLVVDDKKIRALGLRDSQKFLKFP